MQKTAPDLKNAKSQCPWCTLNLKYRFGVVFEAECNTSCSVTSKTFQCKLNYFDITSFRKKKCCTLNCCRDAYFVKYLQLLFIIKRHSSPKNENYPIIYSPSSHPRCICDPLCENPAKVFYLIYYFLHKIILHIVKNILWNYILGSFNIDWVRPCQRLKS